MTAEPRATLRPMRLSRLLALVASLAAGVAAAIALTLPTVAQAWDITHLPAGFAVLGTSDGSCSSGLSYDVVYAPQGVRTAETHICYGAATFQQDLDAFVDANYTAPVTTTTVPPVTTTDAATTTAPTTTAAPPTTTDAQPPAPTTTAVQTVTVTTTIVDPTIDSRLAALEANYAALASRVDAIAKATRRLLGCVCRDVAGGRVSYGRCVGGPVCRAERDLLALAPETRKRPARFSLGGGNGRGRGAPQDAGGLPDGLLGGRRGRREPSASERERGRERGCHLGRHDEPVGERPEDDHREAG